MPDDALRIASNYVDEDEDHPITTQHIIAHTPQSHWWDPELDRAKRAWTGFGDMVRNSQDAMAQGQEQFNQRAGDLLERYTGVKPNPEALGLVTTLMGGVRAPGQPVRIPNPIKAYHGSPHDFNEFDLSKIGTGEGAQAYGHGLYFAESEPVARTYRRGQYSLTDPVVQARSYLDAVGGDRQRALARIADDQKHLAHDPTYVQSLGQAAEILKSDQELSSGRMYEVALHATPESFLDWDKPLSGQNPAVREAVAKAFPEALANNPDMTGAGIARGIKQETNPLAEAGIPGVRYLDQGSRPSRDIADLQGSIAKYEEILARRPNDPYISGLLSDAKAELAKADKGTHNYAVWDKNIIEILKKYGLIPLVPGAMLYGANRDENASP